VERGEDGGADEGFPVVEEKLIEEAARRQPQILQEPSLGHAIT
jgi:hypothetical protein